MNQEQHSLFGPMPPALTHGFPMGPLSMGGPFPPLGLIQPGQIPGLNPQMMMGFDLNAPLFPRPQLYDNHVPIVPSPKIRPQKKHQNNRQVNAPSKTNGVAAKKKEELDDMAMLGIDATDVGASI